MPLGVGLANPTALADLFQKQELERIKARNPPSTGASQAFQDAHPGFFPDPRAGRTPGPKFLRSRGIPTGQPDSPTTGGPAGVNTTFGRDRVGFRTPGFGNEPAGVGGQINNASRVGDAGGSPSLNLRVNAPPRRMPGGRNLARFLDRNR